MYVVKTLLPNTTGFINVYGEPVEAVGMIANKTESVLNTLSFFTKGFVGRIHIYGTLSLDPDTEDWVDLNISGDKDKPYLELDDEFAKEPDRRFIKNIEGAYTYMKAEIDRTYLPYYNPKMNDIPYMAPNYNYTPDDVRFGLSTQRQLLIKKVGSVERITLSY